MSRLVRAPNLPDPDAFYAALVAAHEGLADEASALLNARLVLILANHIGDTEALDEALDLARARGTESVRGRPSSRGRLTRSGGSGST